MGLESRISMERTPEMARADVAPTTLGLGADAFHPGGTSPGASKSPIASHAEIVWSACAGAGREPTTSGAAVTTTESATAAATTRNRGRSM
ncbi:hypothetical protein N868_08915 [Cellulomonas carbonis T26]|uniref:Uncharacterized protein n=1 Tax=Cellulomonas carbonis T26 TaxID=947969 RepID=A0A0A0BU15_9CELL|nr:hypothetical protein N868_08915 [Cellulomonas carbonis T26]